MKVIASNARSGPIPLPSVQSLCWGGLSQIEKRR
jgi:hypothetical protein